MWNKTEAIRFLYNSLCLTFTPEYIDLKPPTKALEEKYSGKIYTITDEGIVKGSLIGGLYKI